MSEIFGVVGSGTMGNGIAQVAARAGFQVVMHDVAEDFLARGMRSETVGLILASVLFGLAHLAFRPFPNWRFAIVGGIAGVFYGLAFLQARSVRASMVTHALVVTTWRVFFTAG